MQSLLYAIYIYFLSPVLLLFSIGIFVYIIMSWLFQLGTLSRHDPRFLGVWSFLHGVIEPVVRPLRRYIPSPGGLDLALFVVLLSIPFLREYLLPTIIRAVPF